MFLYSQCSSKHIVYEANNLWMFPYVYSYKYPELFNLDEFCLITQEWSKNNPPPQFKQFLLPIGLTAEGKATFSTGYTWLHIVNLRYALFHHNQANKEQGTLSDGRMPSLQWTSGNVIMPNLCTNHLQAVTAQWQFIKCLASSCMLCKHYWSCTMTLQTFVKLNKINIENRRSYATFCIV